MSYAGFALGEFSTFILKEVEKGFNYSHYESHVRRECLRRRIDMVVIERWITEIIPDHR